MGWLLSVLGTALAVAGTLAIASGAPYIQLEWGYSEVIAGTTALSAGILAVGIAAVLFALRDLGQHLKVATGRRSFADGAVGSGGDPAVGDSRSVASGSDAPRTSFGSTRAEAQPPYGPGRIEPAPLPLSAVPDGWTAGPADRSPDGEATSGSGRDQEPALFRSMHEAASLPSGAPTVVGRYEANGASYVLFSDGTIEVETETGTHRFGSMKELREHIERTEPG